ncbi:4-amino-4-deoxy-L-arabinose transferase-like glycosyltransferase [Arthrobacter ulcerisalmonis]|nr:glycosyltransferase family 39 protein [Arthrobacter ulcerisalmonis]MDQ0661568.1 4-amino-4-deoxy-L-arabinose transferase-like glycosyltransferase [Arthrobacter ulcerisalmonis]
MTSTVSPTGAGSGADQQPSPSGYAVSSPSAVEPTSRWTRYAFGNQPRWVRPSAAGLLVATAVLYLWNLAATGYGNSFYAAAIQAGTKDWTAFLFGSLDAGNAITVDKPPAALWIPALAGRIFGFSPLSMLVPEALMGVAAVGLLYLTVKRVSGPAAGLLAGGALALTPVAALMFKFNNPDAMLTLCLVLAAYFTTRAIEQAGWKWLAAAGAVIGLAFLTKMLQGFLVVPALGLAYLWAAPTSLGRRLLHLLGALAGIVVVAGSYIALFQLTPASERPYMAGSSTNSFLELTFGYNGLARITGSGEGMPGGTGGADGGPGGAFGGGNTGFGGAAGLLRVFGTSFGGEVSWLLPAALVLLVAGLWFTRREIRTSRSRAALILWGGWLLVTAGVFSFMSGIVHPYYSVAMAPAIAALVGIEAVELWRGRAYWPARIVLAVAVLGTSAWSAVLLNRDASWLPWLRVAIVVLGVLAAAAVLLRLDSVGAPGRFRRAGAAAVVVVSLLAGGLGPGAWTLATAAAAHSGSIPTSGPAGSSAGGFGNRAAGFGGNRTDGRDAATDAAAGADGLDPANGPGVGPGGGDGAGGLGGPGDPAEGTADAAVAALLKATTTKWSAIVSGASQAASLELATNTNVIALGGWNGGDPYPTLAEFQGMVARGQISYFIAGGGGGMGSRGNSAVAAWVQANFQAQTVGNSTVYQLTK